MNLRPFCFGVDSYIGWIGVCELFDELSRLDPLVRFVLTDLKALIVPMLFLRVPSKFSP